MTRQRLVSTRYRFFSAGTPGGRLLGVAVLTLALTAALGMQAPAQAGSNSGVDGCLYGYNYADPASDYLFASSQGSSMDCQYVYVDIKNSGGAPIVWNEGWGYTSTSVVLASSSWDNPLSFHIGACCYGFLDRWLMLDFVY